jgi:hypothetical protein
MTRRVAAEEGGAARYWQRPLSRSRRPNRAIVTALELALGLQEQRLGLPRDYLQR